MRSEQETGEFTFGGTGTFARGDRLAFSSCKTEGDTGVLSGIPGISEHGWVTFDGDLLFTPDRAAMSHNLTLYLDQTENMLIYQPIFEGAVYGWVARRSDIGLDDLSDDRAVAIAIGLAGEYGSGVPYESLTTDSYSIDLHAALIGAEVIGTVVFDDPEQQKAQTDPERWEDNIDEFCNLFNGRQASGTIRWTLYR